MSEREKVINGLEKEAMACGDYIQFPLWVYSSVLALLKEQEWQIKNRDESLEKAREEIKWLRGMLKEQEAVRPILTPWIVNDDGEVNVYRMECGKCGRQFYYEDQKYCSECGTPILWEGR